MAFINCATVPRLYLCQLFTTSMHACIFITHVLKQNFMRFYLATHAMPIFLISDFRKSVWDLKTAGDSLHISGYYDHLNKCKILCPCMDRTITQHGFHKGMQLIYFKVYQDILQKPIAIHMFVNRCLLMCKCMVDK